MQQGVARQIAPSSPESSAKPLSHKFFGHPFSPALSKDISTRCQAQTQHCLLQRESAGMARLTSGRPSYRRDSATWWQQAIEHQIPLMFPRAEHGRILAGACCLPLSPSRQKSLLKGWAMEANQLQVLNTSLLAQCHLLDE